MNFKTNKLLSIKSTMRIISTILCIVMMMGDVSIESFAAETFETKAFNRESTEFNEETNTLNVNDDENYYGKAEDDPMYNRAHGDISDDFYDDINTEAGDDILLYKENMYKDGSPVKGIDVSTWQGSIDWSKVKADGISFVIIRAAYRGSTSGGISGDDKFKANIEGAINAGIPVGAYIFSQAINEAEAREEASYLMNLCKGYNISLPLVLDYEYAGNNEGRLFNAHLSKEAATNVCVAFCNAIREGGFSPMVYANKSMLTNNLYGNEIAKHGQIWLAQYASAPTYNGTYSFWQYSSKGSVNGISGNVDMDYWYKNGARYSVTYELNGGKNNPGNISTFDESTHFKLLDPTKDGYIFKGWYKNKEFTERITEINGSIGQSITVYAKWEFDGYYVKYDANAKPLDRKETGSTGKSEMKFKDSGNKLKSNGFKVKGYKFKSWNTRSDGNGVSFGDAATVGTYFEDKKMVKNRGDVVTLYAQWEPVLYIAHFYKNDGVTKEPVTENVICGDKINKILDYKSEQWTKEGFEIAGWSTNPMGTGKKYTSIDKKMFPHNIKETSLYAVWVPETYTITYDLSGGKLKKKNPAKYTSETPSFTLNNPEKKGYTFIKWVEECDNPDEAEAIVNIEKGSKGNKKLVAVFKENTYTLIFNYSNTDKITLSENSIKKEYKWSDEVNFYDLVKTAGIKEELTDSESIVAWTTGESGKGKKYLTTKKYKYISIKNNDVINLYSQWGKNQYAVDYDMDGADNSLKNPNAYVYNAKKAVKIVKPKKKGFIFKGWEVVSGNKLAFNTTKNNIPAGSKGDILLKAKWEPVHYTVKFKININNKNIGFTGASKTVYKNVLYEAENNNASVTLHYPEYYEFKGWNTKSNGKGISISANALGTISMNGLCAKNNGKVTLYAQWMPRTYNISYVYIDPDNPEKDLLGVTDLNKNKYTYNSKKNITLKKPVKYGFVFKGWYSDRECKNKVSCIKKGTYGDITLYAKWKVK